MSHSLPLPISAARASPGSAFEASGSRICQSQRQSPRRWLFFSCRRLPTSCCIPGPKWLLQALLGRTPAWKRSSTGSCLIQPGYDRLALQHPVASDWQRCAEWGLRSTQKSREATSHETALRARESGEVQNGQRKLGGPRGFSPRSSHQG